MCRHIGVPLGEAEVFQFSNENIFVRILENVRQRDVFIVQPFCSPVSHNIVELLIMIDALKRASAGRITALVPYYSYGRTDKKDQPRVPITARLLADLITTAGAQRVLTLDLHAGQIQGFFNIPVDELTAMYLLTDYFLEKELEDLVVVAADIGIAKRARNFAARLQAPLAIIEKRRPGNDSQAQAMNVIGEVDGKRALIVDDEIDTAGSVVAAVRALEQQGATEIYACCTHAVFSGPALERLVGSMIKEVVVTDTIPIPEEKRIPSVTVLSVAPMLAEAIHRIHSGASVGAMFE
jgi:ribose-phosphate pyrophosphokinase